MTTSPFLTVREHPCRAWSDGGYCGELGTTQFMNGWFCPLHTPNSNEGGTLMELPTWLQQRLGEPSKRRGAKAAKCIKCFKPILVGMSEDVMAHVALVDPIALSPLGEALALIDGRNTYQLGKYDRGLALWQRDHWRIAGRAAGPDWIILTDHKCESTAKFPSVEIPLLTSKNESVLENEPPF